MKNQFIKADNYPSDNLNYAPSVCFYRKFRVKKSGIFTVSVCALGIGYFYLNGKPITEDLFIAPVSDYRKRLWKNIYDVTELIKDGENEFFVELGNGFYNEGIETVWGHHKAAWRDAPTFFLSLINDECEILSADEQWVATLSQKTFFNQLRSGEYFDSRVLNETGWQKVELNNNPPAGQITVCECEPIREQERIAPVNISKSRNGWIFDFGKNVSGYAEIQVCESDGKEIVLKYSEDINQDGELRLNGLDVYQKAPFQTDKLICNGKKIVWKPKFTYHGFRYVEVIGLSRKPNESLLTAIFVCQSVEQWADFICSDESINKIYKAGILSTRANMFYSLTDCPTREKLGWTNDAQASLEQICFNFNSEKLLKKWLVDICDSVNSEGDLPGVVPSPDWGYGHGPICNGIIFSLPYLLFKYFGDKSAIRYALPYMKRYCAYLTAHPSVFGLGDWTGADILPLSKSFIGQIYLAIFYQIFNGIGENYETQYLQIRQNLENYIKRDKCVIDEQSAVAALIVLKIGNEKSLGKQLIRLIEKSNGHIACGMFGIQFLYKALIQIGRADLAYNMVINDIPPSFKNWIDRGATTLWESFDEKARSLSKNHHMLSNVLYFFVEGLCGLKWIEKNRFFLKPQFPNGLSFVKCTRNTKEGGVNIEWKRVGKNIELSVQAKGEVKIYYQGKRIFNALEFFIIEENL